MRGLIKELMFYLIVITLIVSCKNENAKTVPILEEKITKSYKEIIGDVKIVLNSLQKSKHSYYDTCYNNQILNKVEADNNQLEISYVDIDFLNHLAKKDATIKKQEIEDWHFVRSENFNQQLKLGTDSEKQNCANAWQNIYDKRYVMLLEYRRKILPRTNYEHYVLGGMFEGGIYLYDLHDFKSICYFHFRFNNTSNKKEDYKKYDSKNIAKAMQLELIEQMKLKFELRLTEKTGFENILLNN